MNKSIKNISTMSEILEIKQFIVVNTEKKISFYILE